MNVGVALSLCGWFPVDPEFELWAHITDPDNAMPVFEAAAQSGILIRHQWDRQTLACTFCGITQYRVFVQGESPLCPGTPDAKAFSDRADYDKITERIKKAINGEDGMLWNKDD